MKVMVTGGTGLTGIYTVSRLSQEGKTVRTLVRSAAKFNKVIAPLLPDTSNIEIVEGDVTSTTSVKEALEGCDAVVHAAGFFSSRLEDATELEHVNATGTKIVLEESVLAKKDPIVHISSYMALFPPPGKMQYADDPVQSPKTTYAKTKATAEHVARNFQEQGEPIVIIYPGGLLAPHDPTFGPGPELLLNSIIGKKWLVTEGGRAMLDARDLAILINHTLEPGKGARRYMAGGDFLTYKEWLAVLRKVTGRDIKRVFIPGMLLRLIGLFNDLYSKITGKELVLTSEVAVAISRSVPCDDEPAIKEFNLQRIPAEKFMLDFVVGQVESGRLKPHTVTRALEQTGKTHLLSST